MNSFAVSFTSRPSSVTMCFVRSTTIGPSRRIGLAALAALRSPRHRAHPRHELVRAERLGDVVVGAELEAADAVRFFGARGQHDDGHAGGGLVGAQRLADIEAAHARQHDVEDDDVDRMVADVGERLVAGRRDVRRPAGLLQVVGDELRDIAIVFGNEDVHRGGARSRRLALSSGLAFRRSRIRRRRTAARRRRRRAHRRSPTPESSEATPRRSARRRPSARPTGAASRRRRRSRR